ncbi:hypothetical protein [Chrysiogenes arsenatis]|uniref:hypothetical protein n=1 Tax=Chrysiogenes arsenatis TaxID=309797 RepID=UPI0004015168|nr:hypothetical protein [Chrysiogenes arsenatis]
MKKTHILCISTRGVKVYQQQGGAWRCVAIFLNQPADQAAFGTFLAAIPDARAFLIVDIPDEEIKLELVPWVRWNRGALLVQTAERVFRHPFRRSIAITGREKHGRRDAQALCAALQSGDSCELWLDMLHRAKTPIMALRSVALLTPLLLKSLAIRAPHAVIVTIHSHSGVRQSYVRDGQLAFTRLSPIAAVDSLHEYAEMILQEVAKTTRYLLRLAAGEVVPEAASIWIVGEPELISAITTLHSRQHMPFLLSGIPHTNVDEANTKSVERSCADPLFARLIQQARGSDYRTAYDCRYAINRSFKRTLVGVALLVTLLCGATTLSLLQRTHALNETVQDSQKRLVEMRTALIEDAAEVPSAPVYVLRDTVQTFAWLAGQYTLPQQLLIAVSHVLADYPLFRIQTVMWQQNVNHAQLVTELAGVVEGQHLSLHAMYTRFHTLVSALRAALPNGISVESLTSPADAYTTMASTIRSETEPLRAPFAIRITFQAADMPHGVGAP